MTSVIYPLSADPIHNGHINNIKRLTKNFNHVFVAIGKNYEKKPRYLFSDGEKLMITKKALARLNREESKITKNTKIENAKKAKISVELFDGLLVHYANKKGTNIIVRGSRNSMDFESEQVMAEFNKNYGLDTFIIPAPQKTFTLSSTMIKAIVENGGLVHEYTPPVIKQALEEKILGLTLVGVTGNTGSGKTSLCKELAQLNTDIDYIEVDKLIKELYQADLSVKHKVKQAFGANIYHNNNIDRKKLAKIIFKDTGERLKLVEILRQPFKIALEKKIKSLTGIVLIDCAYLVEYGLLPMINYNVVLLQCSAKTKLKRNQKANQIIPVQLTENELKKQIISEQKKSGQDNLLIINTDKQINYSLIVQKIRGWKIV
ncbi:MAG: pantetheine-phosphate adenylyltransferase [Patescibacteria group bacterium]